VHSATLTARLSTPLTARLSTPDIHIPSCTYLRFHSLSKNTGYSAFVPGKHMYLRLRTHIPKLHGRKNVRVNTTIIRSKKKQRNDINRDWFLHEQSSRVHLLLTDQVRDVTLMNIPRLNAHDKNVLLCYIPNPNLSNTNACETWWLVQ